MNKKSYQFKTKNPITTLLISPFILVFLIIIAFFGILYGGGVLLAKCFGFCENVDVTFNGIKRFNKKE